MFTDAMHAPFVGRGEPFAGLLHRLDDSCVGHGSVVLIAGEPGIGKTRLAEELAAEAVRRDVRVLWGRCYEGEGAPAFWPWVQILRSAREVSAEDASPRPHPGESPKFDGELGVLVEGAAVSSAPATTPVTSAGESPESRFRMFEQVSAFLTTLAAAQPLLLILDDIHRADTSTLLLLEYLARELGSVSLLVIGTYRDMEVVAGSPLAGTLARLARLSHSYRIPLDGLDQTAVGALIAAISPGLLGGGAGESDHAVAAVHQRTEGNPFFVAELIAFTRDAGIQSFVKRSTFPPTIEAVIKLRLERFPSETVKVLTLAAAFGREFGVHALTAAADHGSDVLTALEEAEAGRIVTAMAGAGTYRFSHALVQEVLFDAVPQARQVRLHRLAGEALEQVWGAENPERLAEIAWHFFEAAAGGDISAAPKAASFAHAAGDHARRLLAYEEASRLYGSGITALRTAGPGMAAARCSLLLAMGETQRQTGDVEAAMSSFMQAAGIARNEGMPEQLASAALGLGGGVMRLNVVSPVVSALLDEALAAPGLEGSALRARLLARRSHLLSRLTESDRKEQLGKEAVAVARQAGDPATLAYVLLARSAGWGTEALPERLAISKEIVLFAGQAGDRELVVRGRRQQIAVLLELGEIEAADAVLEQFAAEAEALRQPYFRSVLAAFRSVRAQMNGNFDEAERLTLEALTLGRQAQEAEAEVYFAVQLLAVRRSQGRLRRSGEVEAAYTASAKRLPGVQAWRCELGCLALDLGRQDEAGAFLAEMAVSEFTDIPRDLDWLTAITDLADVCAALGESSSAQTLYHLLLPYADRNVVVSTVAAVRGPVSRWLGVLAALLRNWDAADGHFRSAAAMCDRLGSPPLLAQTRYDYAVMLSTRNQASDRTQARTLLAEALSTARELGMERLAQLAQEAMSTRRPPGTATTPPALAPTTAQRLAAATPGGLPDHLTGREAEVLGLIAGGYTNREIAELLVLSQKTVVHHSVNIYRKIGARGRTDATLYAARHGLTLPQQP